MEETILEEGKKFLVSYLRGRIINYETIHPWRNTWEFVVLHSLRVEEYVKKLLNRENHQLSYEEVLLTRLATILHDVGRIHIRENHATLGKDIVEQWLGENKDIANEVHNINRLLYLIEKHSDKETEDDDYCLKILQDADILDEIGAMSIFMASNWIDKNNPYFFRLLSDRVQGFEVNFCNEGFKLLKTVAAKKIMDEKKSFITDFSKGLKEEIYGTEIFGEVTIEEYFGDY
ncbi:HD domain-containing protein [Clostridium sp. UBA4548]|uniref:HD domain-containing protein n=1 Tax=Clostridium sp. UBA4548 TaxID=1946361 RepID=UPI0025C6353F|nr:HD domain-containing protein [Clostridium sp. UBA4548]